MQHLTTFSQLTIHSSTFTVSVATMITLFIEPGRQRRSSTQPFCLMKTTLNSVFIVLGCTGNAYRVSLFDDCITCNCPDVNHACKHVIFLLSSAGLSLRRQLTFSPTDLLEKLHSDKPNPKLKDAFLDDHTNLLCSAHIYPNCYFCNHEPSGTLSICSNCGFLSHDRCLQLFLTTENDSGSHCPRCGTFSTRLTSQFIGRYRNFFHVLRHQGHQCMSPVASESQCSSVQTANCPHNNTVHFVHPQVSDEFPDPPHFPTTTHQDSGLVSETQQPQDL